MRALDAGTTSFLAERAGLVAQSLVWVTARNIATQLTETIGLWTGEDDATLTIDGGPRTYSGANGLLRMDPIIASKGLDVRITQLHLSAVAPEVEDLVKGYDTRFAPVEIHRAVFRGSTRVLVGAPHRVFKGMINSIEFPTVEPGGFPACVVSVASETRALTRTLALKKSDETFRSGGGDKFRQYADVSGSVPVFWGELKASAPADPAPQPPSSSKPLSGKSEDRVIYPGP